MDVIRTRFWPHPRTEAARRFWKLRETILLVLVYRVG